MSTKVTPKLAMDATVPVTTWPRRRVLRNAQSRSLGVGSVCQRARRTPSLSGSTAVYSGSRSAVSRDTTPAAHAPAIREVTASNWVSSTTVLVIRPSPSSQRTSTSPSSGRAAMAASTSVSRSGQTASWARGASWERTTSMLSRVRRYQREAFAA